MTGCSQLGHGHGLAAGCVHNMCAPPRTMVAIEVRPVFGAVIVCLAQCLRLNGLIDRELEIRGTDFRRMGEAAASWAAGRPMEKVWDELSTKGCNRENVDACARHLGGACIGWSEQIYPQPDILAHYPPHNRICTDLNMCLAVLTRRVENLFLSYRPPDYDLEQLLCWAFVADDPRLAARSIPWEQWPLRNGGQSESEECPLAPPSTQRSRLGMRARRL